MVYAQIKNGKIVNTIVLDDSSLAETFSQGFDALVQIVEVPPSNEIGAPQTPSIGWTYDGTNFTPPQGL